MEPIMNLWTPVKTVHSYNIVLPVSRYGSLVDLELELHEPINCQRFAIALGQVTDWPAQPLNLPIRGQSAIR